MNFSEKIKEIGNESSFIENEFKKTLEIFKIVDNNKT